jgi:hypothetical protein
MRLVSTIKTPKLSVTLLLILGSLYASAQQNSPFSRYGLGDILPSTNVVNRAMGGLSAAYVDGQSVNFSNPASYSRLNLVTYDIGITVDSRVLKSKSPVNKYNSVNFTPSYVVLGMPLNKKKRIGLVFGLRPVSSINYSIQENRRTPVDSIVYLYEGSGGLNQAFVGLAKTWGDFSIGVNAGYTFGRKEINTRTFILDTVAFVAYRSNSSTTTNYGGAFINAGVQYQAVLNAKNSIRFGASGNLKHKLSAQQDINRETFFYDANGTSVSLDTVYNETAKGGKVQMPASYNLGISWSSLIVDRVGNIYEKSMVGIEYQGTNWSDYRFYDQKDNVANSWLVKVGGQFTPNPLSATNYWSRVVYRAGFNAGKDQIVALGKQYSTVSFTAGMGFPIRKYRSYDNQYTNINTSIEIGKRGGSENITESFFKFSVGLNLSDVWFIKRKYD